MWFHTSVPGMTTLTISAYIIEEAHDTALFCRMRSIKSLCWPASECLHDTVLFLACVLVCVGARSNFWLRACQPSRVCSCALLHVPLVLSA